MFIVDIWEFCDIRILYIILMFANDLYPEDLMEIYNKTAILLLLLTSLHGCYYAERDNLNDPKSASYKITASVSPGDMETIAAHEDIVIHFTDAMDTSTIVLGGTLINGNIQPITDPAVWSTTNFTNDTLTIRMKDLAADWKVLWPKGSGQQLTVEGTTAEGKPMPKKTITYNVVYNVYVSPAPVGDPSNPGIKSKPLSRINDAITLAYNLKNGTAYSTETSIVCVKEGIYTENSINLINKISVLGGYYSLSWETPRNITSYITTVIDNRTSGGSASIPNRVFYCPNTVTDTANTQLDGFTIKLGAGVCNSGIFCEGDAIITNNIIQGISVSSGAASISQVYGILIKSSSPSISNNTIDPGWNKNSGSFSFGIYNNGSSALINNNTITGGKGGTTYGVYDSSSSTEILLNNSIDCGSEVVTGYCIYVGGSSKPSIDGNTLTNFLLPSVAWGIYESSTNPAYVHNNKFKLTGFGMGGFYYDYGGVNNPVINLTTAVSTEEDLSNPHPLNYTGWDNTL